MSETLEDHTSNREITARLNRIMNVSGYITVGHCEISILGVAEDGVSAEVLEIHRVAKGYRKQHNWTHQVVTNSVADMPKVERWGSNMKPPMRGFNFFFRKQGLEDLVFERVEATGDSDERGGTLVSFGERTIEPRDRKEIVQRLNQIEKIEALAA
jgi:hypothetical protein